jgi:hypothetical protein
MSWNTFEELAEWVTLVTVVYAFFATFGALPWP